MKITAVKPYPITYGHRGMFMVKVETDAGIHGWGEGGISGKEQGMAAIVDAFTPQLLGEDPRRMDHLWQIMFRGGFFESGTVMSGAISAVDIALWDIFGKSVNLPCRMLLGGRSRDRIECYKATNLKEIPGFLAAGWRALRLGPGECTDPQMVDPDACVRSSIEMFREARRIAGEEPKICMDFHTRFNAPAAVQICEGVKDYRPFFIEDPLRSPSPKSYMAFRQRTSVPLAVGEECSSKWEFQQLIESDAIDYARIDLCNVGGLTEAKKVAAMAETHFIDVIPHNPLGPLSTAACIQLSVAIPNLMLLEYGPGPDHAPDLFTNHFKFKAPYYEIPTAPGLGVDVNEGNLAKYPWKAWQCPRMYRPDGAFNNW